MSGEQRVGLYRVVVVATKVYNVSALSEDRAKERAVLDALHDDRPADWIPTVTVNVTGDSGG